MKYPNHKLLILFAGLCLPAAAAAVTVVPDAPRIQAVSWLVMEARNGAYLAEKNTDARVEPASLTKMMTAYVAASQNREGRISMTDRVTVSEKAWRMQGSRMFIEVGKEVSVEDLLKGVIIQSGNDASVALAEHVSGSEEDFARLMNQYADKMGMKDTHFMNSSGWPHENHYTTARDLAILARHLIQDHPEVYALHSARDFTYNGIKQQNRNTLLWKDDRVDGIKTGHTDSAGFCLVASATQDGMRLISVVMGTDGEQERADATRALLNYAYRFFETRTLYSAGETITTSKVWKGERDSLDLTLEQDILLTLPKGHHDQLQPVTRIEERLIAPISAGQPLGELELMLEDRIVATRPLVARETVAQGSFLVRFRDHIKLHWNTGE